MTTANGWQLLIITVRSSIRIIVKQNYIFTFLTHFLISIFYSGISICGSNRLFLPKLKTQLFFKIPTFD